MGCSGQLIQPAQVCGSNGIQALLGELPGADLAMAAAFKASLMMTPGFLAIGLPSLAYRDNFGATMGRGEALGEAR